VQAPPEPVRLSLRKKPRAHTPTQPRIELDP
jgi:hypothetical protein